MRSFHSYPINPTTVEEGNTTWNPKQLTTRHVWWHRWQLPWHPVKSPIFNLMKLPLCGLKWIPWNLMNFRLTDGYSWWNPHIFQGLNATFFRLRWSTDIFEASIPPRWATREASRQLWQTLRRRPLVIIHLSGIFHELNHPAIGYPRGKPHWVHSYWKWPI